MATEYPGAIPTFPTLHNTGGASGTGDPANDGSTTDAVVFLNDLTAELRAALVELGTNPSGSYSTVAAWLAALDASVVGGGGLTAEQVQDIVGAMAVQGSNLTITYNDAANTITFAVTGLGGAAALNVGTTTGTVAAGDDSRITGAAQKASNLSDLANPATARTNLGLGTAATQAIGAFDAAGAATAAQAAAIAASQPLDADLTAIAALTTTSFGRALLALADAAAGRTTLGLGTAATTAASAYDAAGAAATAQAAAIAASQPLDSDLTAIAALTTTSYGRAFLALADAAAARSALGLGTAATQPSSAFATAYANDFPLIVAETDPNLSVPYRWGQLNDDGSITEKINTGRPGAPLSFTVGTPADGSLTVTFGDDTPVGMSAITSYTIQKSTDGGTTWTDHLTGLNPTFTSHVATVVVTGLTNGTSYSLRLRAVNALGKGPVSISGGGTPVAAPGPVTGITGTPGNGQITLAWTPGPANGSPITSYVVERSLDGSTGWTLVGNPVAASQVDSGRTNGTNYWYRVRAVNAIGTSTNTTAGPFVPVSTGGTYVYTPSLTGSTQAQSAVNFPAAAAAAGSSGGSPATSGDYFGTIFDGSTYALNELFLEFDTSPIPDGETVSSVTLELAGGAVANDEAGTVEVYAYDFSTTVEAADHRTATNLGTLLSGSKRVATKAFNSTGSDWVGTTTRITLTNDGTNWISQAVINKTGKTRLVVATAACRTANPLGNVNAVPITTSGTFAPRLTIVTT